MALRRTLREILTPLQRVHKDYVKDLDDYDTVDYADTYVYMRPQTGANRTLVGPSDYYCGYDGDTHSVLNPTVPLATWNPAGSGSIQGGQHMEVERTMMYEPLILRELVCFHAGNHPTRVIHPEGAGDNVALNAPLPQHVREDAEVNILNYTTAFRFRFIPNRAEDAQDPADWVGNGERDFIHSRQYVRAIFVRVYDMGGGDVIDNTAQGRDLQNGRDYLPWAQIRQDQNCTHYTTEGTGIFSTEEGPWGTEQDGPDPNTFQIRPAKYHLLPPMINEIFDDFPREFKRGYNDEDVLTRKYLSKTPGKNTPVGIGAVADERVRVTEPGVPVADFGRYDPRLVRRERRFKVLKDYKMEFILHGDGGREGGRQIDIKCSIPLGRMVIPKGAKYMEGCSVRYFWYFMPSISDTANGTQVTTSGTPGYGHPHFEVQKLTESITFRGSGKKDA